MSSNDFITPAVNYRSAGLVVPPLIPSTTRTDTPREVVSEMRKLEEKLKSCGHSLSDFPKAIAPCLGAKSSKGWQKTLDGTIKSLSPSGEINVVAVLAHTTAFDEITPVLETAEVLSDFFDLKFQLLFAHWDELAKPTSHETFTATSEGVKRQLERRIPNSEMLILDREHLRDFEPFVQAREEIWNQTEGTPCFEDLNWILGFYGRQNSYRPLGMSQALHDFTMRRGIGLLIEQLGPHIALLTEIKERLSRCYRCPCPALNVNVKKISGESNHGS